MPSVLVTGAARGIGRATSLSLAAEGWEVFAGVRREEDASALQVVRPDIRPVLDVTGLGHRRSRRVLPERLDAVINNAGVVVGGPMEALPLDELRRQLEVNVIGQVAVTRPCCHGYGRQDAWCSSPRSAAALPRRCSAPTTPRSSPSRRSPT